MPAELEIAGVQVIGQEEPEEPVDRVVLVGLAVRVALVALAVPVAPVALANRVALEHGPVGAVLARGRPHDRLAVPLGIKSVTALHHHGLAPVPAVEDLAAVVGTTREPAAPEVVAAWAAAE